ncbi:hypothetical protein OBRU01_08648 [Operophtera brumata]|uniref:Granulins domain-containing protein n=1 Tax=Operophtera brumata TaxID=104452 RepID=A0A0L7LH35_OPEBR|nr:hypothetical protein OBRU01_08648 [Operophtera brumata]
MLRYWLCFASALCLAGYCGANYCRDANLCCPGRDSSCVVQKVHSNAIIEDLPDKPAEPDREETQGAGSEGKYGSACVNARKIR